MAECERFFTDPKSLYMTAYGQLPSKMRALVAPAGQHHLMVHLMRSYVDSGTDIRCVTEGLPAYLKKTEQESSPAAYIPVRLYADATLKSVDGYAYYRICAVAPRACADAVVAKRRSRDDAEALFEEAVAKCETAARQLSAENGEGHQLAKAHAARGELYAAWQRWDEAAFWYGRAIQTEPDFIWAYRMRAEAYREQGKEELATNDESEADRLLTSQIRDWAGEGRTIGLVSNVLMQPHYGETTVH